MNIFTKCVITLIYIVILIFNLSGQSLINNPGFENHSSILNHLPDYLPKSTIEDLDYWTHIGYEYISYCHPNYIKKYGRERYKQTGYLYFDMEPHSGKGMVELSYSESGYHYNKLGCASYLTGKFTSPMKIGEVYEISFWIYFPDRITVDTGIFNNIGFYLSRNPGSANKMLETDYFFSKHIIKDEWIQIKYYVRALCSLNYITIGAFKNSNFPTIHIYSGNVDEYYIDDLVVSKVNEDTLWTEVTPTPYCEYFEKIEKVKPPGESVQTNIYFQSNDAILDEKDKERLDSFFNYAMIEKGEVYIISGHTDDQGSDNINLSISRTKVVEDYLCNKFGVSENKFFAIGIGSKNPIGDNKLESGRQQNRRATIRTEYIGPYAVLYRNGLNLLSERKIEESFKLFHLWINSVPTDQSIKLLLDPRIKYLRNYPQWIILKNEIVNTYRVFLKPNEAFFLDSMYFVDQMFRLFSPRELTGFIAEFDTVQLEHIPLNLTELHINDLSNLNIMQDYLQKHGFPKISEVGRRQVRGVCNLLNHIADTTLMRKYLPILEDRCINGEAEWSSYAMMYDRYCLNTGSPQLYGTQKVRTNDEENSYQIYTIDDLESVNERRKKIGMLPIDKTEIIMSNIKN